MTTATMTVEDAAMMFDLQCSGADAVAIWLGYDAIADRQNVLEVLTEARQTLAAVGDPMRNWMDSSAVARGAFMPPTVSESDSPRNDQLRNS